MRISIDATGLGSPKTGTAIYLTEILALWSKDRSLMHEFFVFVSPKARHHFADAGLDERFKFINAPDHRHLRALWQQTRMPWLIFSLGIDVHWGAGFILPLVCRRPMLVTVHDLTFELFPEVHEKIKRLYFPMMIRGAAARARRILAISQTTMADLNRLLPASRGKTTVTLLAARDLASANTLAVRTPEKYALFLGTLEPRKNLKRLLSAWNELTPSERDGMHLVVVGETGWMVDEMLAVARKMSSVVFTGRISDQQLAHWMRGACFLVYPSLYEGFGLPVLEAMASGVPVLTSNLGATREIAEGAALLVDPLNEDAIRKGLIELIRSKTLRDDLSARGLERAKAFSWNETARQTLEALESTATGKPIQPEKACKHIAP